MIRWTLDDCGHIEEIGHEIARLAVACSIPVSVGQPPDPAHVRQLRLLLDTTARALAPDPPPLTTGAQVTNPIPADQDPTTVACEQTAWMPYDRSSPICDGPYLVLLAPPQSPPAAFVSLFLVPHGWSLPILNHMQPYARWTPLPTWSQPPITKSSLSGDT